MAQLLKRDEDIWLVMLGVTIIVTTIHGFCKVRDDEQDMILGSRPFERNNNHGLSSPGDQGPIVMILVMVAELKVRLALGGWQVMMK